MGVQQDDPTSADIIALLNDHVNDMRTSTPAETCYVLDVTALQHPSITFYASRDVNGELQGCCALKELTSEHGEIKSMRTVATHLRKGVAKAMTLFLIEEARKRGMKRLSLETGAGEKWEPARKMYEGVGFERCPVFGEYTEDERSVFMKVVL